MSTLDSYADHWGQTWEVGQRVFDPDGVACEIHQFTLSASEPMEVFVIVHYEPGFDHADVRIYNADRLSASRP